MAGEGLTVAHVDMMGNETLSVQGPALSTLSGYWAAFELASEAIERAVEKGSYTEFHSAVVLSISSIEGYINYRTDIWNKTHQDNQLIDDRETKISLDDKIDKWIRAMLNGKKLDKGKSCWETFKRLRGIRDSEAIHPKSSGYIIALAELDRALGFIG